MAEAAEREDAVSWRTRDLLAATVLFAATAATVLWQNHRVAVMWDISYVLDSAYRMSLGFGGGYAPGQMPYRDFPFVHAPLTFLMQAAVMRLTGRVFFHHVLYAAAAAGLGTVVAWRIALRAFAGPRAPNGAWVSALLLAVPLSVLGIYGILPTPFYDCDCILFVLIAAWLLGRAEDRGGWWAFAAGAAAVLPVFCKQNIGVPFLLVVAGGAAVLLGRRWFAREATRDVAMLLAGVAAAMAAALLVLHETCGVGSYFYWTVTFAKQRRLPGLGAMVDVYRGGTLGWALPCVAAGLLVLRLRRRWASWLGFALLAVPFVPPLLALGTTNDAEDRASQLLTLWPLLLVLAAVHTVWRLRRPGMDGVLALALLAAIHGTMLSQQLWGSTYAIWPLFVVLLAGMLASLVGVTEGFVVPGLAAVAGVTLLVCGGLYTFSEDRLSYADIEAGPVVAARTPALKGMSVRGPYMPEFEQLLDFAAREIPFDDGLILIPGEDPFYYATGRVPRFPVLLFDPTTQPYSPAQLVALARIHDIRWLIVKTHLQSKSDVTPDREATLAALGREFGMYRELDGYAVYRRR